MTRRLLALVLCISTLLSLCTGFASAANTVEDALWYNYCLSFLMVLPAQLFISGPIARAIFRKLFRRVNGPNEDEAETEMREHGIAE